MNRTTHGWTIAEGPEAIEAREAGSHLWRWYVYHPDLDINRSVFVKVAADAGPIDDGASQIEQIVEWWDPPLLIEIHDDPDNPDRYGGTIDPPAENDTAYHARIGAIETWLLNRRVGNWFDRTADGGWSAILSSYDSTVQVGVVGLGLTALDAVQEAQRAYRSETERPHGHSTIGESSEVAAEARQRLGPLPADFGWTIAFAREPDGAWFWLVIDRETGERLKGGQGDTWYDAILAAIEELKPPSEEVTG